MTPSPGRRKPSTTSGAGPAFHGLAANETNSRLRERVTLIPQPGRATRSGSVEGSGDVVVGGGAPASPEATRRPIPPPPPARSPPLTTSPSGERTRLTVTFTLA